MLATIRLGSTGDIVKVAKYLSGYSARKCATENFDESFAKHIETFQKNNGLDADGVVGKNTWGKIAEVSPTCSTSRNSTSAATCALQILLGDLVCDGIFGAKTKAAVVAFQAAGGLSVDGICGPKTWARLIVGNTNVAATPTNTPATHTDNGRHINECVHYLQWDSKWKSIKYSTHTSAQTIGNSGCGPTSMAMIVATMFDKHITPVDMCWLSVNNGCRTYNSGTSWDFFPIVAKNFPFSQYVSTNNVATLKAALAQGALAVCSMNSNDNGFWTSGGHFIVAIGYDEDGYIYANDPNKSEHPRKQLQNKFQSCMKQAFIFWGENKVVAEDDDKSDEPINADVGTLNTDGAILDISKWDGTIDFDALKPEVSLVIARAACGSDPDPRFDEYANSMKERGIPFGVYGYSYAGTTEKATDEARKIYSYASKYSPLFYVYDIEEMRNTKEAILAWVSEMRKLGVERIGAYVGQMFYLKFDFDEIKSLFDFIWIPRYGLDDGDIPSQKYHPIYPCDLWQYTSNGRISGIDGAVDLSIINGDKPIEWFLGIDK